MTSTVYWGYSATATPTAAQVQALAQNKSHGPYVDSYEFTGPAGGQYAVIAFPLDGLVSEVFYEDSVFGDFQSSLVTITVDGIDIDYAVFSSEDVRYEIGDLSVAARIGDSVAIASDYTGASYGSRGGDLTGLTNNKQFTISAWVKLNGGDGTQMVVLTDEGPDWGLLRNASNKFHAYFRNPVNTVLLTLTSASSFVANAAFRHIILSADLAVASSARMYVDDVLEAGPTTGTNDVVHFTSTNHRVGRYSAFSSPISIMNGCMSEIFFHNAYIDLSVEENRRKFRSVHGKPKLLGASGQIPLGVTPIIYMPNGNPAANVGSGGNYTLTGTLPICATSPSQ